MANEDILNKFEKENKVMDEGQAFRERKGDQVALLVFLAMTAVTMIFNRDVKVFCLTVGLFFLSSGISDLYKYHYFKEKKLLIKGIIMTAVGLLLYLTFVYQYRNKNLGTSKHPDRKH